MPSGSCQPVFVGRQPVFDRDDRIIGFELLFRDDRTPAQPLADPDAAAGEFLRSAIVDIGIETLVGEHLAFLDLPRHFLCGYALSALPLDSTVLEIPGDTRLDDQVLAAIRELRAHGFRIATDETGAAEGAAVRDLLDIVRIDVSALTAVELAGRVRDYRARGLQTLADRIGTETLHQHCKGAGFDFFQGVYLSYPNVVAGHRIGGSEMALLRLIEALQWPETSDAEIERLVTSDTALSLGILKLVNSARFRRAEPVESVRRAVSLLGRRVIGQWALLLALRATSASPRVIEQTLIRARMGYQLATLCDRAPEAERFFTLGLISGIDRLFGVPLSEILRQIQLTPEMTRALLQREGLMAHVLEVIDAFEQPSNPLPICLRARPEELSQLYLEAIRWARACAADLAEG